MPLVAVAAVLMAAPAGEMALTGHRTDKPIDDDATQNAAAMPVPSVNAGGQMRADQSTLARDEARKELAAERAERLRKIAEQRREARERAARARAERELKRWVLPVLNYRLSAHFGEGGGLWSSSHTGQDFAARIGTPVRSVGTGEIIFAGWDGAYGNKIAIRHWDGTETWYCHLSQINRSSGTVKPGELIGLVGSTGNSTGPHLHFEVRPGGGDPIDPMSWLSERGLF